MVESHKSSPFHSILAYTDGSYQRTSLCALGLVLSLGHGGLPCPSSHGIFLPSDPFGPSNEDTRGLEEEDDWEDDEGDEDNGIHRDRPVSEGPARDRVITIVDRAGVQEHAVRFCQCEGAESEDLQLLRSKLFPASYTRPRTASTFNVLADYSIETVECKTPPLSFFNKLQRISDNVFPHSIKVNRLGHSRASSDVSVPESLPRVHAHRARLDKSEESTMVWIWIRRHGTRCRISRCGVPSVPQDRGQRTSKLETDTGAVRGTPSF